MPRNVRNFWVEVTVDGRKHKVATGPRHKDGGMTIDLKQRHKGRVIDVLRITCIRELDHSQLVTAVRDLTSDDVLFIHTSSRD